MNEKLPDSENQIIPCSIRVKLRVYTEASLCQPKRLRTSVVDHFAAGSQQVCEQIKTPCYCFFLIFEMLPTAPWRNFCSILYDIMHNHTLTHWYQEHD